MDKQNRFKETKSSEGAFEGRDFYRESLSKLRLVRELQAGVNIENIYLLIKDAACHGKCQIIIDWPGWYIEDKLRELGFCCSLFATRDRKEKDFLISWEFS